MRNRNRSPDKTPPANYDFNLSRQTNTRANRLNDRPHQFRSTSTGEPGFLWFVQNLWCTVSAISPAARLGRIR